MFLGCLNDEFEGIRSQILNAESIPSIDKVYSQAEAEKRGKISCQIRLEIIIMKLRMTTSLPWWVVHTVDYARLSLGSPSWQEVNKGKRGG